MKTNIFNLTKKVTMIMKEQLPKTMTHFNLRVLDIETANIKQEEINESCRQAQEFDTIYSEDNEDVSSLGRYSIDREQADNNRNEDNDGWVEFALKEPKETMEDILYMVSSIIIIDLRFIRFFSWKLGPGCLCLCPFHTRFFKLKNMFILEDKASFMGQIHWGGDFVHRDRNVFVQHCESKGDFFISCYFIISMKYILNQNRRMEGKERSRIQQKMAKR